MQRADVPTPQVVALRTYRDLAIQERAKRLFAESDANGRIEVVKQYLPSLMVAGQREHGRAIFAERCQTCHRLEGQGFVVGPDLASTRANGKEKLLISILDPNREVAPNFLNYVVETKTGDTLTGIIANESAAGITLRRANGDESALVRDHIGRIKSLDQSLMPEGLESGLSHQDMADLLEYIIGP
jgi:putative heme-binding domain-containing protein